MVKKKSGGGLHSLVPLKGAKHLDYTHLNIVPLKNKNKKINIVP